MKHLLFSFLCIIYIAAISSLVFANDSIDGFEHADYDKYNSYASENGLAGSLVYVDGTVHSKVVNEVSMGFLLEQDDGNTWLVALWYSPDYLGEFVDSILNKKVRVFGSYEGYSDVFSKPIIIAAVEEGKVESLEEDGVYEECWSYKDWLSENSNDIIKSDNYIDGNISKSYELSELIDESFFGANYTIPMNWEVTKDDYGDTVYYYDLDMMIMLQHSEWTGEPLASLNPEDLNTAMDTHVSTIVENSKSGKLLSSDIVEIREVPAIHCIVTFKLDGHKGKFKGEYYSVFLDGHRYTFSMIIYPKCDIDYSADFTSFLNSITFNSTTENVDTSELYSTSTTSKPKSLQEGLLEQGLEQYSSGTYSYITNADLDKYSSNLVGVRIYTIVEIDDFNNTSIQATLNDGLMKSNFDVGNSVEDYKEILLEGDSIAVLGTVVGEHDYSFMGKSVQVGNCSVFAVGNDAEKYRKDRTDESLNDYLIITDTVADTNRDVSEAEYKSLCEPFNYEDILRNPSNYKGRYCCRSGVVDQIIEGLFGLYHTFYILDDYGNKWECSYSYSDNETHVVEGDKITVYGKCDGTSKSTTILGEQIILPSINVEYLDFAF